MYQLTLLYKLVLSSVSHDFRQYEAQLGVGPDILLALTVNMPFGRCVN